MDSLVSNALQNLAESKGKLFAMKAAIFLEEENLLTADDIMQATDGDSIESRIDQLLANEEYARFS